MRKELDISIMEQYDAERKAKAYSELVAERKRKSRIEKAKAKTVLSIIGGAFLSLPLFYAVLFLVTLV